jgi:hypothetical protein
MAKGVSRAVAERRAPSKVEADDAAEALWRDLDYFPTPPWAARAVAHRLKQLDPGARVIWESACGEGHFAVPLQEVFGAGGVIASDIYDYGFGEVRDFLADSREDVCDWVLTNHPFSLTTEWIVRALKAARTGVILAPCRLAMLESDERCPLLYEGANPLTCMWPFVERVPMQLGSWDPNLSTATAYAAFVFHKGRAPMPIDAFRTGTKATYWRDEDVLRFAHPAPIPLFEKVAAPGLLAGVGAGTKKAAQ